MAAAQKPVVGITGPDRGGFPAWLMTALAVWRAGGRPRRIRPGKPVDTGQLSGLVIGGGSDVDPLHYGEAPLEPEEANTSTRLRDWLVALPLALLRIVFARHSRNGYDSARDSMEQALLRHALSANKPVLGICRGAQLINVTLGGSLYQRIDHFYLEGTSNLRSVLPRKEVHIATDSRLAEILAAGRCRVNALHDQCVREVGEGILVTARERNGVTQAIELENAAFVIGVQWHPEYLPQSARQQGLFRTLVGHAGNKVMISRTTSAVGKTRERRTGGSQFKRVQRRPRCLWCGPSGAFVRTQSSVAMLAKGTTLACATRLDLRSYKCSDRYLITRMAH